MNPYTTAMAIESNLLLWVMTYTRMVYDKFVTNLPVVSYCRILSKQYKTDSKGPSPNPATPEDVAESRSGRDISSISRPNSTRLIPLSQVLAPSMCRHTSSVKLDSMQTNAGNTLKSQKDNWTFRATPSQIGLVPSPPLWRRDKCIELMKMSFAEQVKRTTFWTWNKEVGTSLQQERQHWVCLYSGSLLASSKSRRSCSIHMYKPMAMGFWHRNWHFCQHHGTV